MKRGPSGRLSVQFAGKQETYRAFIPHPLPPDPSLEWNSRILRAVSHADTMLGRLDGIGRVLPDTNLFIATYSRREAVLSSQIEGMQSTLSELLLFEADESSAQRPGDLQAVTNYLAAMRHGLKRMHEGFPLSLRLIREMHEHLLKSGRGSDKTPGEFRTSQNWIGGTGPGNAAYIPPPAAEMHECLDKLEKFLHREGHDFTPLVQAAMLHVQFESIHPFLDGNGRLGRLLVTLLLIERGLLTEPLLYPSLYLKQHRETYYRLLQDVRLTGDWEAWIEFFLDGIATTAQSAVELAKNVLALFREDEDRLKIKGARHASVMGVLRAVQQRPVTTASLLVSHTSLSLPTVNRALEELQSLSLLEEVTGRERNRIYRYTKYVAMLNEGTEL